MRILVTSPYPLWPESSGGVRRTLGIARALASSGHQVTLLSAGVPPPASAGGAIAQRLSYPTGGRLGHFINPGFSRALHRALAVDQDLLIAGFPYQAHSLTRLCRRHHIALVYDAHNVEAKRFASLGNPLASALVSHTEAHLVQRASAVLAVSPDDQQSFAHRYGRRPLLLPNGVDDQSFVPGQPERQLLTQLGLIGNRVALYCGSFDYQPNVDAVATLLQSDWPLQVPGMPDTHLLIVGRRPPAFAADRPGVVVTGEVPELVPYLQLAHLVLAPLASGGGTRLKIIEALACGQQVLSTPFGAAGLSAQPIPGLHVCELADFPAQLKRSLEGPLHPGSNTAGRRWATGMSWRTLVCNIDWQAIASQPDTISSTPQ